VAAAAQAARATAPPPLKQQQAQSILARAACYNIVYCINGHGPCGPFAKLVWTSMAAVMVGFLILAV